MITIECKEDIELLELFFNRFSMSEEKPTVETEVANSDVADIEALKLNDRITTLELSILQKEDVEQIKKDILDEVKNMLIKSTPVPVPVSSPKKKMKDKAPNSDNCIRQYSMNDYENIPKIQEVKEDGKLVGGKNHILKYNIYDLKKLQSLIPQTELSFRRMSSKIGVSDYTIRILSCGLELGKFDKILNDWEQMEANRFYKKNDEGEDIVENNPQKRKEKGMV